MAATITSTVRTSWRAWQSCVHVRHTRAFSTVPARSSASARQTKETCNEPPSILVTGAQGQLGKLLVNNLRKIYGGDSVLASDIRKYRIDKNDTSTIPGPYKYLDVLDYGRMEKIVVEHNVTHVIHFSALLSAIGEKQMDKALKVNNNGTEHVFELARHHNLSVFCPSTIGVFGPTTPRDNTPDLTIMRPTTIYGITKVYMELLGEYYHNRFGVDFRSLRLPGVLSADTDPGGGTTDYAVAIFHHAVEKPNEPFRCYLRPDSELPMIMIDDCVRGMIEYMQASSDGLSQRTYNLAAVSFTPAQIAAEIKKRVPGFEIVYEPDERQAIADSWPNSFDDSNARRDWGWSHDMGLERIVDYMLESRKAYIAARS